MAGPGWPARLGVLIPVYLAESREVPCMVTIRDFIEDWIEMRSTLTRQLELLESGEMHTGSNISEYDDTSDNRPN
jgi:hypothetical protein